MIPRLLCSTLFPYTTLFRSTNLKYLSATSIALTEFPSWIGQLSELEFLDLSFCPLTGSLPATLGNASSLTTMFLMRSEEHTSELQSRRDLVCRLLLEKKKLS